MKIIYIGDIHSREKEPFQSASLSFLDWLYNNYKDDIIIFGGDIFDKSSHNHKLVTKILKKLIKFREVHLNYGNHDKSRKMGSILEPFSTHKHLKIYETKKEVIINNISFIFLPHLENMEEYKLIEGSWDYSVCHHTPMAESFSEEGIELPFKINIAHLYSHIHRYREYIDTIGNKILIAGSVLNTRYGEQDWEKNIYEVSKDGYKKIPVPEFFTYEDVIYGQEPESKENILNIKEAPSFPSVYERYKGYYIKDDGIELIKQETEDDLDFDFKEKSLKYYFSIYAEETNFDKYLTNLIYKYLD